MENGRLYLKPGRTNKEDRENFVKFWVTYMNTVDDAIWSKQQNIIIDSQIQNVKDFYRNLSKTKDGRDILGRLRRILIGRKI